MRTTAILTVAAATHAYAWAQSIPQSSGWGERGEAGKAVPVCMKLESDVPALTRAEQTASKMFAEIGVEIEWSGSDDCHLRGGAIVVTLSYAIDPSKQPGAYAFSRPYEGTHIVIFWDRIQHKIPPPKSSILLAHVLAHEITHILQIDTRHSKTGVMKAAWSDGDLFQMVKRPLRFTAKDVQLIYLGMAARSTFLHHDAKEYHNGDPL
jgi:hypothetical protein